MTKLKTLSLIGVAVVGVGVAYSQVLAQTPLQDRVNILRKKMMELRSEELAQSRPQPAISREQSEKSVVILREKIAALKHEDNAPADALPPSQQAKAVVILREKIKDLDEQSDKLVLLLRHEVGKFEAARLATVQHPAATPAPETNVSIEKLTPSAELAALTEAYKADEVTAGEYHRERARLVTMIR